MRIFGGYLPFIGFREEKVDDELREFLELPKTCTSINTFQLAWFDYVVCFPIYPEDHE